MIVSSFSSSTTGPAAKLVVHDTGEVVDLLDQLHPLHFLHRGLGPGGLVGGDRLDPPSAEQAARSVDLFGGERVPLERGQTEDGAWSGLDRDVTELHRRLGYPALRRVLRRRDSGDGEVAADAERRAESGEKLTPTDLIRHLAPPPRH
jgi:hypothetical protein